MANQNFKVKKGLEVGTGVTISGVDGNINISGILTAIQFSGDGSGLTGVTAEGSGVSIRDEGSLVGTAATINFIGGNVVAVQNGAITDVTVSTGGLSNVVEDTTPQLGGNLDLNGKNITGIGSISITGSFNATGVSTFQENVVFQSTASFGDNDKINAGTGNDLQIYHNGSNSYIDNATGDLFIRGAGGSSIKLQSPSGEESIVAAANGSVDLYYDNSKKLETTNTGVTVTGTLAATAVTGDGSGLTGLPAAGISDVVADTTPQLGGNLDLNSKDITGTGDINLTGVSTFRGAVNVGHGSTTSDILRFFGDSSQNSVITHIGNGSFTLKTATGSNAGMLVWADGSAGQITLRTGTGVGVVNRLSTTNTGVTVTGTLAATAVTGDGSALTGLTGASAGTYGASALTPIITVDSNGRITGIATVPTSGAGEGSFNNVVEDSTPQLGGDLDLNGNDISGTGNITITSTDAGSSAGPEFKLWRNSASPADADYLGQIKFAGESDTGVERNYAKITGKIGDASNGTEDGIIEIAHIKAGSQNISARWKSTELQFLNGTNVSWADSLKATFGDSDDLQIYHDGSNSYIQDSGTGDLRLDTNLFRVRNAAGSESMIVAANDGAVSLYHDNALRLATTNTGVNITDSLSVAGISTFSIDSSSKSVQFKNTGNTARLVINMADSHSPRIQFISSDGDTASLYGDSNANVVLAAGNTLNLRANTNETVLQGDGNTTIFAHNVGVTTVNTGGVSITGVCTATSFSGDGSGLTNLPASGISTAFSNVQATWSVNSSGSSSYRFTGPGNDGTDDNPDLYLVRGQRYRFTNNSGGSHPFQIRSSPGGSAYSTGVTNNGGASGNIDFNVQHDAPARLYYQCTSHSAMVGNIYITGGGQWQNTAVAASGTPEIYTDYAVGIGTVNPSYKLQVENSGVALGRFLRTSSGAALFQIMSQDGGNITLGLGDVSDPDIQYIKSDNSDNSLSFGTNTGERLSITSTGKCEVYKGTSTTGKTSGSEAFTVGNGGGNHRFAVYPDGTTVIGGTGDIGNNNIQLTNNGNAKFAGTEVKIGDTSASIGDDKGAVIIENGALSVMNTESNTSQIFGLYGNGTSSFKVTTGGEVTIKENILLGTFNSSSSSATGIYGTKDGVLYVQRAGSNQTVFGVYNGTTNTVTIDSDGTIQTDDEITAGSINVSATNITGTQMSNHGIIYAQRVANSSEAVFQGWAGTSKNIEFTANGKVTATELEVTGSTPVKFGGQSYATAYNTLSVGNSTYFDISGSVFVFVKIMIKVGYGGNSNYQMHAQYDYATCNYSTSGATATRTDILQVEAGNAQFNYSDISITRPSNRTVRVIYAPSSGSGTHAPRIYVSGVFDSITVT